MANTHKTKVQINKIEWIKDKRIQKKRPMALSSITGLQKSKYVSSYLKVCKLSLKPFFFFINYVRQT